MTLPAEERLAAVAGRTWTLDEIEHEILRVRFDEPPIHFALVWYREDFPAGTTGLGEYLARFFPGGAERTLLESGAFEIRFTDYDWSLNARR